MMGRPVFDPRTARPGRGALTGLDPFAMETVALHCYTIHSTGSTAMERIGPVELRIDALVTG